jgi:hypothetical protein
LGNSKAGWYDDGSGQLRWWDGQQWTSYYFDPRTSAVVDRSATPVGPVAQVSKGTSSAAGAGGRKQWPAIVTAIAVALVVVVTSGLGGFLLVLGVAGIAVGLFAVLNGSWPRLRIHSRAVASGILAAGLVVSTIGGVALAAANAPTDQRAAFVGTNSNGAQDRKATPTPSPTPTPVREETILEERTPIPFTTSNVDDPNIDVGASAVVTPGVNGEKLTRIRVVTEDGVEVQREVIDEVITVQPVNEVIAVGTRQPPPPPPPAPANNGCDPNYDGACVPIASDVDCAGGSGNGPAYVAGPVRIIGVDIYDLDRDGDGIACDT